VIFQPHLYSRTRDFAEGFAKSLSLADTLVMMDIYPARELPIPGVTSDIIFKDVTSATKIRSSKKDLLSKLEGLDIEVIATVGAGDIDTFVKPIKEMMTKSMKVKFNIKKEIRIGAALIGLSFLIAFSERKQAGVVCKDIVVELENISDNHFLDEDDILRLVESSGVSVKGTPIERIDLRAIEKKLKYDKHIKEAELYGDLKGNLIVTVELRRPIARIVQEDGPDAYISEEGIVMGVSEKFSSRVMIMSGRFVKQILEMGDLKKVEEGQRLLDMIHFINENNFWRAQVAQLDISSHADITVYPQVTGQLVEFGTSERFEEKFTKLMVFYKEILPQKGWTRYERVNLKYEGQVIAE